MPKRYFLLMDFVIRQAKFMGRSVCSLGRCCTLIQNGIVIPTKYMSSNLHQIYSRKLIQHCTGLGWKLVFMVESSFTAS